MDPPLAALHYGRLALVARCPAEPAREDDSGSRPSASLSIGVRRWLARKRYLIDEAGTDWHTRFPDPTIGDAILDRLVHNGYRLELQGESPRKLDSPLPMPTPLGYNTDATVASLRQADDIPGMEGRAGRTAQYRQVLPQAVWREMNDLK